MTKPPLGQSEASASRERWLAASARASELAASLFQPGSGYGDPDARVQDEHQLQTARHEAERLFREYHDLDRKDMEQKLLEVQQSQRLATWASFAVAVVVGVATIAGIVIPFLK